MCFLPSGRRILDSGDLETIGNESAVLWRGSRSGVRPCLYFQHARCGGTPTTSLPPVPFSRGMAALISSIPLLENDAPGSASFDQ